MNSTNTIDHLESLKSYTMKKGLWKRLILIWDNASFHLSKMVMDYINTQKEEDWLNIIYLPKKARAFAEKSEFGLDNCTTSKS